MGTKIMENCMASHGALPYRTIATKLSEMGVPTIPIPHGQKKPELLEWQKNATTNLTTIAQWAQDWGEDANCGCVATLDGYWYLDMDDKTLGDRIEAETGK